ncbi:MAG TPA: indolepyruvate ferredoxin oxidoreductase subunit alpha [Hyphomicrobiaceae bacterium]|nr:indolepyruvate ferredoxin oxidoreductase subunit alpha [Hyphomicrobiaceae bacterium]
MAEVSFHKEIESLRLGAGEIFYGEGILAVTKALLQSGVSYVGGYQGAPVSHLLDALVQSQGLLGELGVHLETSTNEAAAAAMLAASINYPLRGAVTWKSIVGTNVAADALSNLASPGVQGGALIIVGEDYGEGASVIQERTYAFALKSSLWLLDPRPDLPTLVRSVEKAFELSETSSTPVILELRIRACHMFGSFATKDNVAAAHSANNRLGPAPFNYDRLSHPPATFRQEADKVERRLPAARRFIMENKLNEQLGPGEGAIGIIVQGGLFNVLNGRLALAGLSDVDGGVEVPTLVLNVVHPLVPEEITRFCTGKSAVLVVEEGAPDFIEQAIGQILRKAGMRTKLCGKDVLPMAGEYTPLAVGKGLAAFLARHDRAAPDLEQWIARIEAQVAEVGKALVAPLPARPPTFCTGCPERPVFSAMKLLRREMEPVHICADIGCHSFATFAPFSQGNSILGYGMSLASAAAVSATQKKRPISVMGDGGFWHNGLITGVAGAIFNRDDSVLVVMNNGYASATGQQEIVSSVEAAGGRGPGVDIATALKSLGVGWIKRVQTYRVAGVAATLRAALRSSSKGLKVVIADGECQLARQRRLRPEMARKLAAGERVVRTRFWVDPEVCTGDHSCIRLSGCPSLTIKPNEDPLRRDPVAYVNNDCVGCGLCGEVAHAAQLCPSFARIDIIQNPTGWDRLKRRVSGLLIRLLGGGGRSEPALVPAE